VAIKFVHKRAAVIDLDVHQGDGTASIFAETVVFTLSLHGAKNFVLKQKSSIDIAFADGTGDDIPLSAETGPPAVLDFAGDRFLSGPVSTPLLRIVSAAS